MEHIKTGLIIDKRALLMSVVLVALLASFGATVAGASYPSLGACYLAKGYNVFDNLPPQNVKDDCLTLTLPTGATKPAAELSCDGPSVSAEEAKASPYFQKLTEADAKRIQSENLLLGAQSLRDSKHWYTINAGKETDAQYLDGNAAKLRAESLQTYFELLQSNPKDVAALIGIGQVRLQEKNYDVALQSFLLAKDYATSEQLSTINNILSNAFFDQELKIDETLRQKQIKSRALTQYTGTKEQIETLTAALIEGRVKAADAFSTEARKSVDDYLSSASNPLALVLMSPIRAFRLFPYPAVSGADKFESASQQVEAESSAIKTVLILERQGIVSFINLDSIDAAKLSAYSAETGVPAPIYRAQINRVKASPIYQSISITSQNGQFVLSSRQADLAKLKSSTNLVEGGKITKVSEFIVPSPWALLAAEGGTRLVGVGHRFAYSKLPAYTAATDYIAGAATKSFGFIEKNLLAPTKNKVAFAFAALTKKDIALSIKALEKPAQDRALSQLFNDAALKDTMQCFGSEGNPFAYAADINAKIVSQDFVDKISSIIATSPDKVTLKLKLRTLWKDTLLKESFNAQPEQRILLDSYVDLIGITSPQNDIGRDLSKAVATYSQGKGNVEAATIFADQSKVATTAASEALNVYVDSYISLLEELKAKELANRFISEAEKKVRIAQIDEKILGLGLARHDAKNHLMVIDLSPGIFAERLDPVGDKKIAEYLERVLASIEITGREQVPPIHLLDVVLPGENVYGNLVAGDFADIFAGQISSLPGKWGSKAIVYLDSTGNYQTAFFRTYVSHQEVAIELIKNDLLANRAFLMRVADAAEKNEIEAHGVAGVNNVINKISERIMNKDYPPEILGRIASYEAQFDPITSKLSVTAMGATTTQLQMSKGVVLEVGLKNSLQKNIAGSLLPEGQVLQIEAPAGLFAN